MKRFTVITEYNGKEVMRVAVTGIDASDAFSSAKVVFGNKYELRVIT